MYSNLNGFESNLSVVTSPTFYSAVQTQFWMSCQGPKIECRIFPHTGIYNFSGLLLTNALLPQYWLGAHGLQALTVRLNVSQTKTLCLV